MYRRLGFWFLVSGYLPRSNEFIRSDCRTWVFVAMKDAKDE
jgi:hypothetical protein